MIAQPKDLDLALAISHDIFQPLQRLVEISVCLLGADKGSLQLYDEREKVLKLVTHVSFDEAFAQESMSVPADLSRRRYTKKAWPLIRIGEVPVANDQVEVTPVCAPHGIVMVQAVPLLSNGGNVIGVLATHFCRPHSPSESDLKGFELCAEHATQIIEHRKLERDLRATAIRLTQRNADLEQRNANLVRSNQDLERFAFAASHDLQEPLRMITTYAELLARRVGGTINLGEDAAALLSHIVQGALRMRDLLADLLTYAEVEARGDETPGTVDLNALVQRVEQALSFSIEESGASIIRATLPTLLGHQVHFFQLFQNLIANAIKYRSELPPRIYVSVEVNNGKFEFAVEDNGIGIGAEYHKAVFQPFKRLHDKKDARTRIGLAICERVVERYGGRIWVESQKGHGSIFRFILPDAVVGLNDDCDCDVVKGSATDAAEPIDVGSKHPIKQHRYLAKSNVVATV
jgi:signal transduction histidine kinase